MTRKPPFAERGGTVRGVVDVITGSYPRFIFGGALGETLPVFHFHEVIQQSLEPHLAFLHDNKYETVTSEEIHRFVKQGEHPGPRTVALCFDDAWASLWTVAAPLLKKYDLRAITYVIPARVKDAETVRPTIEEDLSLAGLENRSETPFATWPELQSLFDDGVVDIQSHTLSHSMIYCSSEILGFATTEFLARSLLSLPSLAGSDGNELMGERHLGAPVYPLRSRVSDARRYRDNPEARDNCVAHVAGNGGEEFFKRDGWRKELSRITEGNGGFFETDAERKSEIEKELYESRAILNERLQTDTVRHLCFPWGIAGEMALKAARDAGYESAFSDRMFGHRSVRYGDNPFRMMRLPHRYIFRLRGINRQPLISMVADRNIFRRGAIR